jgi:hypothetical protein
MGGSRTRLPGALFVLLLGLAFFSATATVGPAHSPLGVSRASAADEGCTTFDVTWNETDPTVVRGNNWAQLSLPTATGIRWDELDDQPVKIASVEIQTALAPITLAQGGQLHHFTWPLAPLDHFRFIHIRTTAPGCPALGPNRETPDQVMTPEAFPTSPATTSTTPAPTTTSTASATATTTKPAGGGTAGVATTRRATTTSTPRATTTSEASHADDTVTTTVTVGPPDSTNAIVATTAVTRPATTVDESPTGSDGLASGPPGTANGKSSVNGQALLALVLLLIPTLGLFLKRKPTGLHSRR